MTSIADSLQWIFAISLQEIRKHYAKTAIVTVKAALETGKKLETVLTANIILTSDIFKQQNRDT